MSTAPAPASRDWRDELLTWYNRERRNLPWRAAQGVRADPYHVLVSEVMLQQTTVATVTSRFAPFIARFPTIAALAAAELDDVLHAWRGLGYYRRARNLHACARAVVERHGGALPSDEASLAALPGLGAYTVGALRAIAFEQAALPVDANVRRVLARLEAIDAAPPALERAAWTRARYWARVERAGDLAQAVMDLGAMICAPATPRCASCPIATHCQARALGLETSLPKKAVKRARPTRHAVVKIHRRADGAVFLRKRPDRGVLAGMIEAPSDAWEERPSAAYDAPPPPPWRALDAPVEHGFTHFILKLRVWIGTEPPPAGADGFWAQLATLDALAIPTLTKKVLRAAGIAG